MTEYVPAVLKAAEYAAVPELSVALPKEVVPLRKVTVPVAAEGLTVADSATVEPACAVDTADFSVVVVAVVPVELVAVDDETDDPLHPVTVASVLKPSSRTAILRSSRGHHS